MRTQFCRPLEVGTDIFWERYLTVLFDQNHAYNGVGLKEFKT